MTEGLKEFYRSYKTWLDNGAKDGEPYTRKISLCQCLYHFAKKYNSDTVEMYLELSKEMDEQFRSSGLDVVYPFDTRESYGLATTHNMQHLNKKRVEWVSEHAS